MTKEEIESKLKEYSKAYHEGKEIVSDSIYDALCLELKKIYPESSFIDSDIEEGENFSGFEKKKHNLITGTLRKCRNEQEAVDFLNKHKTEYSVQHKIDGSGCELVYENGILKDCITRGNGFEGFSILNNFKKIKQPSVLSNNFTGSIRGELYMKNIVFQSLFKDMKNPRNACSGIIKRLNGEGCENLSFIAYDILSTNILFKKENEKLSFLNKNGFQIPKHITTSSISEIIKFREETSKLRNFLTYPIDGIVCKVNDTDYEDLKRRTPLNNFAIKFDLDTAISTIIDIEWNIKGNYLSPVAILKPVELNGTIVSKATLHNTNRMVLITTNNKLEE